MDDVANGSRRGYALCIMLFYSGKHYSASEMTYRVRQNVSLKMFLRFSQPKWLRILRRNFTNSFSHAMRTLQYYPGML